MEQKFTNPSIIIQRRVKQNITDKNQRPKPNNESHQQHDKNL